MTTGNAQQPHQPVPSAGLRHLRPDVKAMTGYTPGEQVRDCVKLNTNECPWPPSPNVLAALRAAAAESLRLYPEPRSRAVCQAAAAAYGVSADQVLIGNGSDDCLTIVYRAFLRPGDRIACPWPTYGLYDTLATLQGAEVVHVDYVPQGTTWKLPATLAKQAAKLVIVANPNNPSATLVPVAELRQLASELDGVLVVDEAYVEFAGDGASLLPHLDRHPNLIVLRTFSKSYSLAGARLGMLFAHPEIVAQLMKVKDSYNVNSISQALGVAALNDKGYHRDLVRRTISERARLEAALTAFGWTWPDSAANFLLCEVGPRAEQIYLALKSAGILVRWWATEPLRTKLRITVGRPEWNDRLLSALRELHA
ncbi:MAG: histidinol-phosphate transaminase [Planctomycetes bacterium]|nr:histidinol-phosphate transaminase [Planctomycetota bacterium]